jgi:hypothetical protein
MACVTDCRRFALAVLPILLTVISAVTPLAYASPPDPSWIQGIYDDDDFDDVVVFIASGTGAVELFLQSDLSPVPLLAAYSLQPKHDPVPALLCSALQPRAPPPAS